MSFPVKSRQMCFFIDYLYIEIFLKARKKKAVCILLSKKDLQ